jgi:hypothetical protein
MPVKIMSHIMRSFLLKGHEQQFHDESDPIGDLGGAGDIALLYTSTRRLCTNGEPVQSLDAADRLAST